MDAFRESLLRFAEQKHRVEKQIVQDSLEAAVVRALSDLAKRGEQRISLKDLLTAVGKLPGGIGDWGYLTPRGIGNVLRHQLGLADKIRHMKHGQVVVLPPLLRDRRFQALERKYVIADDEVISAESSVTVSSTVPTEQG